MGTPVRRRGFLTGLTAATAVGAVGAGLPAAPAQAADSAEEGRPMARRPSDRKAALEVRAEFLHAWQGYRRLAWGRDELMPVAGKGRDFFAAGHPVGLTIVESLDTLYLMELDDELVAEVMHRYGLSSEQAAVDFALRRVAADAMSRREALAMAGTGWDADLGELRAVGVRSSLT